MLKKTTLAVLGLAASSFATAGSMGPVCVPGNVTVPCEAKRWDVGVQALYLRPIYNADKGYRNIAANGYSELANDWDWGYRLEGSYHFNTGNDVSLNWTHYNSNANQTGLQGLAAIPLTNPVLFLSSQYALFNNNKFDQVNLDLGQHVDVGLVKKMRFYGGLQYAHIESNATNYYNAPLNLISLSDNTDFKGVGPVVGIDYAYELTNALSLTANGSSSILYGTSRYNAGYIVSPVGLVITSAYAQKKAIVPSLEAKLGLNYAYHMTQGILNFEGGYQAVNYFNVLQTQLLNNLTAPISTSDYGLYGPYFGVKYVGLA